MPAARQRDRHRRRPATDDAHDRIAAAICPIHPANIDLDQHAQLVHQAIANRPPTEPPWRHLDRFIAAVRDE